MPHKDSKPGWLSVTEVLNIAINKPFLNYWYGAKGTAECERIKRESQELGIEVHRLIEERFIGKDYTPVVGSRSCQMLSNFWREFVGPYAVEPIELEKTCKDEELKLQGTFDGLVKTSRGERIGDWKTSNTLDAVSVPLQLSAYDHLENGNGLGLAVRIDKVKDKVEVHWYEDLKKYWPVYLACLKVAKFVKFGETGGGGE